MAGEWIVRVGGREYGPVDLDELRDWKREGRLIRENEIRESDSDRWFRAGELPEIFSDEPAPPEVPKALVRRLTLGQIFTASWRIYRAGFWRFFALSSLVAFPAFVLQLAVPFLEMPKPGGSMTPVISGAAVAFAMLVLLVIAWPFSIAGLQLLAADLFTGQNPRLRDVLARAKLLWMRIFVLGLVVYGSYLVWTIIPLLLALSLATGAASLGSLFLTFCLLIFTVYMVARLFINFLFWQQAGALGTSETVYALRESKELARSQTDRPWMERPLYRGALIASIWLLVILGLNIAIELPVMLYQLRNVTTLEEATTALQSLKTMNSPDLVSAIATFLGSLFHAILRPWLAAIFVVLYFDTKVAMPKSPNNRRDQG
ncbi:MAG TPA: DUF4339 domain-containing protein [Chthoniobacterales bacterium]|nr:DUF4339 domain-containing protein [Chthoniobacterales bacterium]